MSPLKRHQVKILLIFLIMLLFILVSEGLYIYTHRDVLSRYVLKTSTFLVNKNAGDKAFYLLSNGKLEMPDGFKVQAENYLKNIPEKRDLPRAFYDLAVLAHKNGQPDLAEEFFKLAIKWDPDFSFWRVELANYFLSRGSKVSAEKTMDECMTLPLPRKHCSDFKNNNVLNGVSLEVGFSEEEISNFYRTKTI